MQVYEIFEELRKHFNENSEVPISVTLETVGNLLACSKRNANFALKRLLDKNWITWKPGRGRGNSSVIIFHITIQEMYVEVAKEKVKNGDINGSLRIIENNVTDLFLKNDFFQWLNQLYGVHSDEKQDDTVHILRVPMIKEIGSLDPILTTCGIEAHLVKHIFDTLVVFNPVQNRIEPGLAHFWETKDHIDWTLYLRKGVFFHDGKECSAQDVLYTFQRLMKQHSLYSWIVRDIIQISHLNNWTIKIKLFKSNPYFLHYLAAHPLSILPEKSNLHEPLLPIGTGPFKVIKNDTYKLIFQANNYHYAGRPFLDKVELWKIVENNTKLTGVRPDVFQLEKLVLQHTEQKERAFRSASKIENGCKLITFNLNIEGPHQSKLFRKAMNILLQSIEIVRQIDWEDYSPAFSLLDKVIPTTKKFYSDYKKVAIQYVEKSGYKGQPVLLYCSHYHVKDAILLQKICQEIGINIEVRLIEKKKDAPYPKTNDAQIILFECLFDHDLTFSLLDLYLTEGSYIRRHLPPNLVSDIENRITTHFHCPINSPKLKDVLDEIEQFLLKEFAFI
ncbi:MAG TPA: ABC transporter substrate-binding protein, partial [Pseudoneobacillus sp.]|nr:ABC transporter substrate-binding protein [Pseudoneobacillus sp.]